MKQFDLSLWLKDKSRRVVTRSGHNVRILCTDQRGNMPIVALVEFETLDGVQIFYSDGKNESHREYDLFFADEEEEELTEFDYAVLSIISDHNSHTDSIEAFAKRSSKKLLDLARSEILKEFRCREELFYKNGFERGRESILKDFPKWKKAKESRHSPYGAVKIDEDGEIIYSDIIWKGEYFIMLQSLKTLSKEE